MADLLSIGKKKKRAGHALSEEVQANAEQLVFTNLARQKVIAMFNDASLNEIGTETDVFFRIAIRAGGCSGLEYDFSFTRTPVSGDTIYFEGKQPHIAVDPKSLSLLKGSILDVVTGQASERLVVINPKAKTACSCGASFSLN